MSDDDQTVLIPYFSDEVYHSTDPTCSFMDVGAEETTRRTAEETGHRPCKRCFHAE